MPQIYPNDIPQTAAELFGVDASTIGVLELPLDDKRENHEIQIGGTVLWAVDASSKTVKVNVGFNRQSADKVPVKEGTMMAGLRYSKIYVSNAAQAGGSITLVYLTENVDGQFRVLNPADQFNNVNLIRGTTAAASQVDIQDKDAAGGPEQLVAADSTRRRLWFENPSTTATIWMGVDNTVDNTNGFPLRPRAVMELTASAQTAVWIWQDSGGTLSVPVFEEKD